MSRISLKWKEKGEAGTFLPRAVQDNFLPDAHSGIPPLYWRRPLIWMGNVCGVCKPEALISLRALKINLQLQTSLVGKEGVIKAQPLDHHNLTLFKI